MKMKYTLHQNAFAFSVLAITLFLQVQLNAQPQRWEVDHMIFESAYQIVTGDMDSDGDPDILINDYPGNIIWFENTGNSFSTLAHVLDVSGTWFRVSDIDSDGFMDIIASHSWDMVIKYYLNTTGNGIDFESHDLLVTDGFAYIFPFELKDLDMDGDDDVVADAPYMDFGWFENKLNTGEDFSFHSIDTTDVSTGFYLLADFDNDTDNDIITASTYDNSLYLFKNLGGGNFSGKEYIASVENINDIKYADLQNDNDFDIIATSGETYLDWDQGLYILYNTDGLGNFSAPQNYYASDDVFFVTLGNIDTGHVQDLAFVTVNWGAPGLYADNGFIFYGSTDSILPDPQPVLNFLPEPNYSTNFGNCLLADMNNDSLSDLIMVENYSLIYSSNSGTAEPFTGFKELEQLRHTPAGICNIDLNGDDNNEYLVLDRDARINSYQFDSTLNTFSLYAKIDSAGQPDGLKSFLEFDYNNDGFDDLFVNTYVDCHYCTYAEDFKKVWLYNNIPGQGIYADEIAVANEKMIHPVAADVNGDGFKDIIASYPVFFYEGEDDEGYEIYTTNYSFYWLQNNGGDGTFTRHMIAAYDFPDQRIAEAGDIDADGDIDIISFNYLTDEITWWENSDGLGNFYAIEDLISAADVSSFKAFDEDNDGDEDLAFLKPSGLYICVNDAGVLSEPLLRSAVTDGLYPGNIILEDVNHDSYTDIISGNYHTFYYQNIPGTGIADIPSSMNFNYDYPISADINHDGFSEIIGISEDTVFAIELNRNPVYFILEHTNDSLLLNENQTLHDTIRIRLNTIPAENCFMHFDAKFTYDPEYEILFSGPDAESFTMTFTPDSSALNWQTVVITAIDDVEQDSTEKGRLQYNSYSLNGTYDLLLEGKYYYSILDNDYEVSNIEPLENNMQLNAFYDASISQLQINCKSISPDNNIRILTSDGRLIYSQQFNQQNNNIEIDCTKWSHAMYLIQFFDNSGLQICKKLVIN